jgi:site-specific DNA-methyltransferase (adenine-specific)
MTPYYTGPLATLFVADCRDVAPTLPARSVDLLIADPPYGVGWRSNRRAERFDDMAGDDGITDWPRIVGDMVRRLVRNSRHVYVFGYEHHQVGKACDLGATAELIWNKEHIGPGNLEIPWGPEHERCAFGVYNWSARNREKGAGRLAARLRQGSVIHARRPVSGQVRHPDEKPVALLRQLVEASSVLGETVFDPTCGVGSTGVAAVLAGRRFIGIELDLRYANIAVDRLKAAEHIAQMAGAA